MSLIKANSVQIGQSNTATNNFTLSVPSSPDGTIKLARGNSGATTSDILTVTSGGVISGATINGGTITLGTAQATTSGTAIDFTGIPSWVKRITVILENVSASGSSPRIVQLGTSSGIDNLSYSSYFATYNSTSGSQGSTTAGFGVWNNANNDTIWAIMTICQISSNKWVSSHSGGMFNGTSNYSIHGGGSKTLSGVLDRIRLTHVNGTDTFDSGSANIMYEG